MALRNTQLIAVFNSATNLIDIAEINMWINAVRDHIHAQGYKTDISCALTIAE